MKRARPAKGADQQSEIAWVADVAVNTRRAAGIVALDPDQSAEATPEHEDRPEAQRTTTDEQDDAGPARGITVNGPQMS